VDDSDFDLIDLIDGVKGRTIGGEVTTVADPLMIVVDTYKERRKQEIEFPHQNLLLPPERSNYNYDLALTCSARARGRSCPSHLFPLLCCSSYLSGR